MTNLGNKKVFSENLEKLMKEHGKSRNDVCQALGFKYSTFSEWATGKKYPRIDKIEMLANYFGVLKSDLIEEKTVQKRIEENPVKMAERHFEIIMDEDFTGIFDDFQKLDDAQKKIVKDLIHNMAETKVEA